MAMIGLHTAERNAEILEAEVLAPLKGVDLTEVEYYVASKLLTHATSEKPLSGEDLKYSILMAFEEHDDLDERGVKQIIRTLRKQHSFPILSRRNKPWGYWWCQSREEMLSFIEQFQKQPLDELGTLHRIVRRHFPELSGQLKLIE